MAACRSFLDVTDLVEHMLLQVDEITSLRLQQTSRAFYDTVKGSIKLQQKLFLVPAALPQDDTLPRWRVNPLFANQTVRLGDSAGGLQIECNDIDPHKITPAPDPITKPCFQPDPMIICKVRGDLLRAGANRPRASWNDMLLLQPVGGNCMDPILLSKQDLQTRLLHDPLNSGENNHTSTMADTYYRTVLF